MQSMPVWKNLYFSLKYDDVENCEFFGKSSNWGDFTAVHLKRKHKQKQLLIVAGLV